MIEVNEKVLVKYIEDTLWCMDSYGYYYSNTKGYLLKMIEKNILGLSDENLKKLEIAVNKRIKKIKSERATPKELALESKL